MFSIRTITTAKCACPRDFAFNAADFMGVLVYMVVRETQKAKATIFQTFACVFAACLLHAGIVLTFPQIFAKLLALAFGSLSPWNCSWSCVQKTGPADHETKRGVLER
jgi:hypothetical protein